MDVLRGTLDLALVATIRRSPQHGYAIIADLRERSNGTFDLPEGTVYPALHRLERAGLITSHTELVGGRRRRIYAVTPAGVEALAAQQTEWRGFVRGLDAVLRAAPA